MIPMSGVAAGGNKSEINTSTFDKKEKDRRLGKSAHFPVANFTAVAWALITQTPGEIRIY